MSNQRLSPPEAKPASNTTTKQQHPLLPASLQLQRCAVDCTFLTLLVSTNNKNRCPVERFVVLQIIIATRKEGHRNLSNPSVKRRSILKPSWAEQAANKMPSSATITTVLPQRTNRHAPASPHSSAHPTKIQNPPIIGRQNLSELPCRTLLKMSAGSVASMIIPPLTTLQVDMTTMRGMMKRN